MTRDKMERRWPIGSQWRWPTTYAAVHWEVTGYARYAIAMRHSQYGNAVYYSPFEMKQATRVDAPAPGSIVRRPGRREAISQICDIYGLCHDCGKRPQMDAEALQCSVCHDKAIVDRMKARDAEHAKQRRADKRAWDRATRDSYERGRMMTGLSSAVYMGGGMRKG